MDMFGRRTTALAICLLALLVLSAPDALAARPPKPTPTPAPPISNPALVYAADGYLYLMTADGASKQQLTADTLGDRTPTWRGDGSEIAFVRKTSQGAVCSLWKIKPDGTELTQLFDFCAAGEPPPGGDWQVDWSPDGTMFAYASNLGTYHPHLYVLDIATGDITDLTPGDDPIATDPSWSPDGTKIAYNGAPDPYTPRGILALDLLAGTTTNLTPGEEAYLPAWSSDGEYIAYFSGNTLMKMASDGTGRTSIVTVRDQARPTWSSDDQFLAFHNRVTVKKKTTNDLFRVAVDGTGLTNLTNTTSVWEQWPDWNPAWDPNG